MSHRSKVEFFARAASLGYRTYLYFIATDSSQLNVYRVQNRITLGGHYVPEDKIVDRYKRCLGLLGQALSHAYRAFLFDNSGAEPIWLAELTPQSQLRLKVSADDLPQWFKNNVLPAYPNAVAG